MGDADRSLIAPFFLAFLMALQFDIDILAAEDAHQSFDCFASGFFSATHQRSGQRPLISACQTHQAGCVLLQIIEGCGALFFVVSRILNCVMSWQRF